MVWGHGVREFQSPVVERCSSVCCSEGEAEMPHILADQELGRNWNQELCLDLQILEPSDRLLPARVHSLQRWPANTHGVCLGWGGFRLTSVGSLVGC